VLVHFRDLLLDLHPKSNVIEREEETFLPSNKTNYHEENLSWVGHFGWILELSVK
jgi:hypothetical protein